jgi:hypothetical protein
MKMLREDRELICVRYVDHVLYNRAIAVSMKPQIRKAVGWLIYECEQYIILTWDHDDEPPTLHGDPKSSGLVLLKSDILHFQKLQTKFELDLNCKPPKQEVEYALQPTKRKTQPKEQGASK